ncbi:hypothetical protein NDK50_20465 [Paraburkholderia bryophila]|uniref:hypothetical protein n=1 Tax=Paraburkholderia bryophila TaxID=420952 RepID=UPI00234ACB54|nr:hypothetical protein [Paraburkholderia bryophila]WCM19755.1 hypothetical protein NDK50_20465 [Paraburkholderia bryophila]
MVEKMKKTAGGLIYFLRAHPAAIVALDPDSGETQEVFVVPAGTPDGIQVDGASRTIYWTNMGHMPASGEAFPDRDGTIECCSLDGENHRVLVGNGAIVTPKQIQLDPVNGLLYWCDREGMAIYRSRTDGSDLTELLRTGVWPDETRDVLRHCVGIALDGGHSQLYWTQKGPPDGGLGKIFRMGLSAPAGATPEACADVELLLDHLPEPIDLEIDHEHRHLYWTDRGDPVVGGNSLNRADMTAQGLANHRVLATGLKEGIGLALDLERKCAYVADLSGAVWRVPMDGGEFVLIHQCAGPVTGVAFLPATAERARSRLME